jgi:hypothetical protein
MSKIRLALLTLSLLAATGFVVASNGASAAPPAKVGVTYTKVGSVTPFNGNYRRVVELSLPAGKYLVGGKGSVQNQQALDDQVSCNVYAGSQAQHVDASTTNVRTGEVGVLAFSGVATLATAGVLWVECISSQDPGALTAARITATTAADVITLP